MCVVGHQRATGSPMYVSLVTVYMLPCGVRSLGSRSSHVSPLHAGAGTHYTTARGLSAGRVEYQPNRFVWFVRRDIMHNRQRVFRNFGAAIRTPVITINFRTNYGKSVPLGSSVVWIRVLKASMLPSYTTRMLSLYLIYVKRDLACCKIWFSKACSVISHISGLAVLPIAHPIFQRKHLFSNWKQFLPSMSLRCSRM